MMEMITLIWICLTLLLACATGRVGSVLLPWNPEVLDERAEQLLSKLRENIAIDLIGSTMKAPFLLNKLGSPTGVTESVDREILVRNLDATEFIGSLSTSARVLQKKKDERDIIRYDAHKLSSELEKVCSVMSRDYWNYEWCHRYVILILFLLF
jgi:hypothetical protein